ncbi:hypothetical protein GCM10011505_46340 [Tistrella bauzanensis]|uniref:Uncharacterized protein n=2 Tax=Tistrella bauzanensis TaxID=657419 RepID=A0ABQ1J8F9_9PROT|nr:hypothetical protein GCM10011505_46340 [Tistrella bauzanensis]
MEVAGAHVGDRVICTLARDAGPDIQVDGVVSAADMVTIQARNTASTAPVLVSVSLARD